MDKFDENGRLVDLSLRDKIADLVYESAKGDLFCGDPIDITVEDLGLTKETDDGLIHIDSFTAGIEPTDKDILDTIGKDAESVTIEDLDRVNEEDLVDVMTENHYEEVVAMAKAFAEDTNELNAFGATFNYDNRDALGRWGGTLGSKVGEIHVNDGYGY